jgi:hypothetical protein
VKPSFFGPRFPLYFLYRFSYNNNKRARGASQILLLLFSYILEVEGSSGNTAPADPRLCLPRYPQPLRNLEQDRLHQAWGCLGHQYQSMAEADILRVKVSVLSRHYSQTWGRPFHAISA